LQQFFEHADDASRAGDRNHLGRRTDGIFAVDIVIDAYDRQGLLRDVSDVLAREKLNVIAVNTQSRQGNAHLMRFTAEVGSIPQLNRTLALLHEVQGVVGCAPRLSRGRWPSRGTGGPRLPIQACSSSISSACDECGLVREPRRWW
jgi:predicted amino acid-binding ACT domain protein